MFVFSFDTQAVLSKGNIGIKQNVISNIDVIIGLLSTPLSGLVKNNYRSTPLTEKVLFVQIAEPHPHLPPCPVQV